MLSWIAVLAETLQITFDRFANVLRGLRAGSPWETHPGRAGQVATKPHPRQVPDKLDTSLPSILSER